MQEKRHFWLALVLSLLLNSLGMAAFCLMLHAHRGQHSRAFELIPYGDGGDGLPVGAATLDGHGTEHAVDPLLDHDIHTERTTPVLPVDAPVVTDAALATLDALPEPVPAPVPKPSANSGTPGNGPAGNPGGTGNTTGPGTGRGGTPGARHGVRLLDSAPPTYPEAARQQGIEGRAVIHLTISAEGHVTEAKLHQSSGSTLLEAALRHARTRRFAPARQDGLPVASTALYPVDFRLTDRR